MFGLECGSGRALAEHAQGLGFDTQHCKRKKENKKGGRKEKKPTYVLM